LDKAKFEDKRKKEGKEGTVSKNDSAVWVREGIEMNEGRLKA